MNKKNVTINITSIIKHDNNAIDEKSSVHIGKQYLKDNQYIIFYSDNDDSKVKLTIFDNKLIIKREEFLTYTLEFDENKKTSSTIKTEHIGFFDINIITNTLQIDITDKEITIHINYDVINNDETYLKCDYVFLIR